MKNECFALKGALTAQLFKADGTVQTIQKNNMIVNVGFDFVANAIGLSTNRPGVMNVIAVGTGTTAVAATQTALTTQLAYKTATYAHTSSTKVFTFTTTFNPGEATGAITEAGVFNGNGGIMFDRVVFSVINKGADDTLKVTFTFTMS
nr:MAG TPA: tail-collar fiber protein [Caudoviricetes sp.]